MFDLTFRLKLYAAIIGVALISIWTGFYGILLSIVLAEIGFRKCSQPSK